MKWTKLCGALLAAAGMMGTAFAGTCAPLSTGHAGDKSTGCAPAYQPCASKPVICRPDYRKVCSYQRSCTKQTLNGCNIGNGNHGGHGGAGGAGGSCVTAAPSHGAGNGGSCGTNAGSCRTNAGSCGLPTSCGPKKCGLLGGLGKGGLLGGLFNCKKSCDTGCAPAAKAGCAPSAVAAADPGCAAPSRAGCAPAPVKACGAATATRCCTGNSAEIAALIAESQTACYAKQRRRALTKLGKFDCVCNPEIMNAFVIGLNDCDERVREEAAVQIRKQTRCGTGCCNAQVVAALTCALSDCDRGVRRAAEKALEACGYEVRDCQPKCTTPARPALACAPAAPAARACAPAAVAANGCAPAAVGANGCAPVISAPAAQAMPAPVYAPVEAAPVAPAIPEAVPAAPAPAADEPAAYYPSKLKSQQTKAKKSGLSNLFGLRS